MSFSAYAKALAGLARNLTLYAAPCLSAGSLVAFFHRLLELDHLTAFTLGFFAAVGPVYLRACEKLVKSALERPITIDRSSWDEWSSGC